MMQSLVTIGITAFNAVDTIKRAIDSALSQTWRPIEIVVVDDGSTDATLEVLQQLAKTHPELQVYSNSANQGVAATRNHIISKARGEFLAFFDDDDKSDPKRIEKQVKRICNYERQFAKGALVVCYTARQLIYPDGSKQYAPTMGQMVGREAPSGVKVAERILMGTPLKDGNGGCPTCSQLARLSTFRALNGFDPQFRRSEDTEFNIRLALAGGHFAGIAEPLVQQFMTKTSDKNLADEYRNFIAIMHKHRAIMDTKGQHQFCMDWLAAKRLLLEKKRGAFLWVMMGLAVRNPILTLCRLWASARNLTLNLAFSNFHHD